MNAIDKVVRYFLLTMLWGGTFFFAGISQTYNPASFLLSSMVFIMAAIFSKRAAWQVNGNTDKLARYGFLSLLWFVMYLFTVYASSAPSAIFYGSYMSNNYLPILWLVALITVIITSFAMFPRYDRPQQHVAPASVTAKRKNDHYPPVDPLDLLTDDDLAELRQEIKDEIRARLRYGSDDAVSSLEELIEDHQPPARAKRK